MTAETFSTSPRPEMKTSSPPRPRPLHRLRNRFSKENRSSPNLLGVRIKRFSEFENYSGRSRGTLGGFSPLPDIGSPEIDSLCLEKLKNVEKECVLTQLTKKIGLGIYTRGRDVVAEKDVRDGYVDLDGDERETWYMFYPPPPSPSLALEAKDCDSASSLEPESVSSSSPSAPIVVSEVEVKPKVLPRLSAFSQGSQYAASNPTSPVSPTNHRPIRRETNQGIDIDALILSAETLAEQYRGLLLTPFATPRLPGFQNCSENGLSISPFPSQSPSPLSFYPPSRPQTPRTLRKIKRQHSLRKLVDVPIQQPLPSPMTPTTLRPQLTTVTPISIPTSLTPPPSAKKLTPLPPLTPPPALRSPDFLSHTFTPEPLHPTRLSLAAHPDRSPTPSQGAGKAKKKKKVKREFAEASMAPEPPPRESSRWRGSGQGAGGGKEKKKAKGGADLRDTGRKRQGKDANRVGSGIEERSQVDVKDRGRNEERRRRSPTDEAEYGRGDVNEGGEGWL